MAGVVVAPAEQASEIEVVNVGNNNGNEEDVEGKEKEETNREWSETEGSSFEGTRQGRPIRDLAEIRAALRDGTPESDTARRLRLSEISDEKTLFEELRSLLEFDHPKVRTECAGMIARIMPRLDDELESCAVIVLPGLVLNLGHSDEDVRQSSAVALIEYMDETKDVGSVQGALVMHGLLNEDTVIRKNVTSHLPLLFVPRLASKDWRELVRCLIFLIIRHKDTEEEALRALQNLRALIGDDRLRHFLQQLDDNDKKEAAEFLRANLKPGKQADASTLNVNEFSFVSVKVIEMLMDKSDWKARVRGIEELKYAIKVMRDVDLLAKSLPNFLDFLAYLLKDVNFKVVLVALEIYGVVIDKLKWQTRPHLSKIVTTLVLLLGESKVVVRSQAARVVHSLMHCTGPSLVVTLLCKYLVNPIEGMTARTREEVLNAVTLAMLTFPSYEFDLNAVCGSVAPSILDARARVRQACLECLAVLAQAMGSSKLAVIASAIDIATADEGHDSESALTAILARLARRQLPRITPEGQVEYSVRIWTSAAGRASRSSGNGSITGYIQGADVEWILAGSGSLGTCGSANSRITPVTPPLVAGKMQSASFPSSPAAQRRIVNSGQGKQMVTRNAYGAIDVTTAVPEISTYRNFYESLDSGVVLPAVVPSYSPKKSLLSDKVSERGQGISSGSGSARRDHHDIATFPSPNRGVVGNGMVYSTSSPKTSPMDRGASARPLDKVAAMLGNNILPSKLRPIQDDAPRSKSGRSAVVGSTLVPLASNTPPGNQALNGSLPAIPQRKKVLGPITDQKDVPIPTRPTLVRSSSGGRRARVPPIGQMGKDIGHGDFLDHNSSSFMVIDSPDGMDFQQEFRDCPASYIRNVDLSLDGSSGVVNHFVREHSTAHFRGCSPKRSDIRPDERALDNLEEVRGQRPSEDYRRSRGSVDSGVESLAARPRSRSSTGSPNGRVPLARLVNRRPRSLDLNSSFSTNRLDDEDVVEDLDTGDVSPDSLSRSETPDWYEADGGCVVNRAVSEVSSLSSSSEQLPVTPENDDDEDDDDVIVQSSDDILEGRHTGLERKTLNGDGSPFTSNHGLNRRSSPVPNSSSPQVLLVNPSQRVSPGLRVATSSERTVVQHQSNMGSSNVGGAGQDDAEVAINVVGRGMHPVPSTMTATDVNGGGDTLAKSPPIPTHQFGATTNVTDVAPDFPSIQGKRLSHMSQQDSMENSIADEEEDPNSMSLSRSTFNKMMSRKMEMMKEAERRKRERQQRLQEQRKAWLQEQESKKIENTRPKTPPSGPVPPPGKPVVGARRLYRHGGGPSLQSSDGLSSSFNQKMGSLATPKNSKEFSNERLLKNPDEALRVAFNHLQTDDWNLKCEGIRIITDLCQRHPASLNEELHNVNLAILTEVKNLRSTVARAAIHSLSELFETFKKGMEPDLETTCKVLLHKSGESNVFIKEDVEKTLIKAVDNVSPQRAVLALILGGATHRNVAVRKTTALLLVKVCEKLGANRILSGTKDVTDRIIITAAQFVMDGSPITRFYGRKIFYMLMSHPDFDRVLKQHVQPNTLRNIQDILEGLKSKGLGNMPTESNTSRHLKGSK